MIERQLHPMMSNEELEQRIKQTVEDDRKKAETKNQDNYILGLKQKKYSKKVVFPNCI
jgi:hypothetical protein